MDNKYYIEARKALLQLEALKQNTEKRFQQLDAKYHNVNLVTASVKGNCYYYARTKSDRSRSYLGRESNEEVREIKEHRYLQQLLADVDSEIEKLQDLINDHRILSFESINNSLPEVYRSTALRSSTSFPDRAQKWKAIKEKEKAQFKVKHPEQLIMTALDGTPMRSKSEMSIANLLISHGIPYVYELPHVINGIAIYTDITALSLRDCKTEIWFEHEGMMDKPFYQKTFLDKVNAYLSVDKIPGRDIFFTFDDLHGGFDISPVMDIIKTRLI